jgi:pimeloyl-ACP methyl ester carboxylesterase
MRRCFAILSIALVAVSHRAIADTAETCKDQWMTQNIDHFGKHNGTFQQRYTINTDSYAPGGPILLFQGEETDVLDCPKSTILYEWARELGGLTVSLEHRYFGPSKPFGNASTSNENFRFLTLDNVMADAVAFVQQVKRNITGADKSKVLVASGSYGGFLAAAFRMNHAESFDAALASAGPVVGFGDGDDPDSYNWYNWLNRLYLTHSLEASANIEKAFTHLSQRLVNNDTESLQRDLRLCTPIFPGNATQAVALEGLLQLVFSLAAEFNYPRATPGRSPIAYPFFEILKIATNATDPIKLLASANWMWYEPLGAVCLDHEHPADFVKAAAVPLINYTVFDYITCKPPCPSPLTTEPKTDPMCQVHTSPTTPPPSPQTQPSSPLAPSTQTPSAPHVKRSTACPRSPKPSSKRGTTSPPARYRTPRTSFSA